MGKPDARFDVDPTLVRTTMKLALIHAIEQCAIDLGFSSCIEYPDKATHAGTP